MINPAVSLSIIDHEVSEVSAISLLLTDANSSASAYVRFAEFLVSRGYRLLMVFSCNSDQQSLPTKLYSDVSEALEALCAQCCSGFGCPIVQKAMQNRIPFEALGADYSTCEDFSRHRYLKELERLGHQEIAVIPVRMREVVHIAVVGLNERLFRGANREYLMNVYGQFASAFFVKFPEMGKSSYPKIPVSSEGFSKDSFSARERDVIYWQARGKNHSEIAEIFGLSEQSVQKYSSVARSKLGARSEAQSVAKAVKLGLFDIAELA